MISFRDLIRFNREAFRVCIMKKHCFANETRSDKTHSLVCDIIRARNEIDFSRDRIYNVGSSNSRWVNRVAISVLKIALIFVTSMLFSPAQVQSSISRSFHPRRRRDVSCRLANKFTTRRARSSLKICTDIRLYVRALITNEIAQDNNILITERTREPKNTAATRPSPRQPPDNYLGDIREAATFTIMHNVILITLRRQDPRYVLSRRRDDIIASRRTFPKIGQERPVACAQTR